MSYIPYAIALFRHEESVNTIKLYRIDQKILNLLRTEIAADIFNSNRNHTALEAMRSLKKRKWHGGSPNSWVAQQAMWHTLGNR